MNLEFAPEALSDIQRTRHYISKKLKNPTAAQRIVNMIFRECERLKVFPDSGVALVSKVNCGSDFRYIVCEKWLAFYRVKGSTVKIVRVLDGRTDYLQILLDI